MPGIFNRSIFNNAIFNTASVVDDAVRTGGKGDNEAKRRSIVKPTGLLHLPKKEGRKDVQDRVDESRQIEAEIAGQLAREFGEETAALQEPRPSVSAMPLAAIEAEIGMLLRKKLRTEEDEILLLMLMVAAAAAAA